MFVQPGLQLAFGLHFFLQRAQCVQPRANVPQPARFAVHRGLRGAALVVQLRHLFRQVVQPRFAHVMRFAGGGFLLLQRVDLRGVGRLQALALTGQPFTPALKPARLLFNAAAFRGQHLNLLLYLRHHLALLVAGSLRTAHGIFQRRPFHRLLFGLRGQHASLFFGLFDLRGVAFQLGRSAFAALGPLGVLRVQIRHALLCALAAFNDIANAFFQAADFQCRFTQVALFGVQHVIGRVVGLTHCLQHGFNLPQVGHAGFQRGGRLQSRG